MIHSCTHVNILCIKLLLELGDECGILYIIHVHYIIIIIKSMCIYYVCIYILYIYTHAHIHFINIIDTTFMHISTYVQCTECSTCQYIYIIIYNNIYVQRINDSSCIYIILNYQLILLILYT